MSNPFRSTNKKGTISVHFANYGKNYRGSESGGGWFPRSTGGETTPGNLSVDIGFLLIQKVHLMATI